MIVGEMIVDEMIASPLG